jgi:hypothetical protein
MKKASWTKMLDSVGPRKERACDEAREWAATQPDPQTAWNTCERADWMLWLAVRLNPKACRPALFACADIAVRVYAPRAMVAAASVLPPAQAKEVARHAAILRALSEITDNNTSDAASDAARAASDAARAASYAASDAARAASDAARAASYAASYASYAASDAASDAASYASDAASDAARAASDAASYASYAASDAASDAARAASDAASYASYAASDAARAASDAARAASYAASDASLKEMADLVRKHLSVKDLVSP